MKPTPSPNTRFPAGRASVAGIALVLSMLAGCAQDAADHVDADDVQQAAADDIPGDERGPATPPGTGPDSTAGGTVDGTGQVATQSGVDRPDANTVSTATAGASSPYLVNGAGSALYFLEGDADGSGCVDHCIEAWPPALAAEVAPSAGDGVDATMLGTINRGDGSVQVTYGGKPLYRYAGDVGAGRTNGMNVRDKYGQWHLVGADGKPVAGEAAAAAAAVE